MCKAPGNNVALHPAPYYSAIAQAGPNPQNLGMTKAWVKGHEIIICIIQRVYTLAKGT